MASPPRVNFLIAGVQKGGTTALFDYLQDYPDLALPQTKELHFFDDETRDWSRPDYDVYHAAFPEVAGRPCGEATPIYTYWPNCLERIRAYNPAMKLIVVLRDPIQRAWSHWRMEYARGVETQPFDWCIREGRQRLFEADPWGHHREFSYVERGFYGEQMERLLALFPADQVLTLRSDQLRIDPGATLGAVREFLGLPPAPTPRQREVHVGREMDYPSALTPADVDHLRSVYAYDDQRLAALTGVRFS
jgi:hypothetical protein